VKGVVKRFLLGKSSKKYIKWGLFALAIIPAITLLFYIKHNAVNVPYWDQYELVPIIQQVNNDGLVFNDLWQQHNEHRIFFPRVIMLAAAVMTGWDVRYEMVISWVIAVASFILLLVLLRMYSRATGQTVTFWLPLLLSIIFFSLIQHENWLWGWQVQWYLSVFGVMLAAYGVARIISSPRSAIGLVLTMIGAIIAEYSLGNGVLIWPIIIVALAYCRVGWRRLGIVSVTAVLSTVLYYVNYYNPPGSVSKTIALQQPIDFIGYVALYLGRPVSYSHLVTVVSGVLLGIIFVSIGVYLYKKHKERFKQGIPWFMLGSYVVAGAVLTGIARLGFGVGQALSSRYTTLSLLLLVSVVVLIVLNRDILRRMMKRLYRPIAFGFVAIIFALVTSNAVHGKVMADELTVRLNNLKDCTHQETPSDACYLLAYPDLKLSKDRLDYLKLIHWGGY
jgi:hypothetical protein